MKGIITATIIVLTIIAVSFAETPKRIISLAPSVTESLYQLGLEDRVVAITMYCPRGTHPKEIIGTLWEPNIEKIAALSPDLVIISKEGNQKSTLQKLQELRIPTYVIQEDRDFKSLCDNYLGLGRRVGKEKEAREIVAEATRGIEAVRKRVATEKPLAVFWEVGAQPLFTISNNSFINDFNTYAGSVNLFRDVNVRYPKISREEVVRRDPDAIIIVAMGDVTKNEQDYWRQFGSMAAVRNKRIYVIRSQEIFTPTPLTFLKGVERIAALLHPPK